MAALKPYCFGPNMLLRNDSIVDSLVNNRLEKKEILLTLKTTPSQLQVFLFPANFKSDGMTSHKNGLAAKTVSK